MCKKLLILLTIFTIGCLPADERKPSIKQLEQTKQSRSVRPTAPLVVTAQSPTQACCCGLKPPDGCLGSIVAGIIEMPSMDSISGGGPGFSFIADDSGFIQLTFQSLIQPVVTATVENDTMPLVVQIVSRSDNNVILRVGPAFDPAQQTFINFHAIELHCN